MESPISQRPIGAPSALKPPPGRPASFKPYAVSALQLMSNAATFVDTRNSTNVPFLRATNTPSQEEKQSVSNYNPLDPNFKPAPQKEATSSKKPVASSSSAIANLLGGEEPTDTGDDRLPAASKRPYSAAPPTSDLIGGYEGDGDPYQTTAQAQQAGDLSKDQKKAGFMKKKAFGKFDPDDLISPITGEKIADYGNWARNLKKQQEARDEEEEEEEVDLDPTLTKLRNIMAMRGAKGVIGLGRMFKNMDDDGNNSLSFAEFAKALKEIKMNLKDPEIMILFKKFDRGRTGGIIYDDFIRTIAGNLNKKRKKLVRLAFNVLDKDKSGVVDLRDMAQAYDVSRHPDFIAKKKTKDQVLTELLEVFDVGGAKDGVVTLDEFENYYANISASIPTDKYFELMIRNAWHIPGGEGEASNSANLCVLVTSSTGEEHVIMIEDDLGLKHDDLVGIYTRLNAQGVKDVVKINGKPISAVPISATSGAVGLIGGPSGGDEMLPPPSRTVASKSKGKKKEPAATGTASPGIQLLVDKIKQEMKSRGSGGFIGLQRRFKIMDDDGSKMLGLAEFKKALKEFNMDLSDGDLRMLFKHFDADGSGSIDFEEFVQGVRDPLSEARQTLVKLAFNIIDKDGSGIVNAAEIAQMYDASRHPDVISKKKKPADVLREFLDTFDVGGVRDGQVTLGEFMNYYANLGASIDNDQYFELMMRNAWHIAGGSGQAANSANKRVLVTDSKGVDKYVTLISDLGLRQGDAGGICRILKSQGITDVAMIDGKKLVKTVVNGVEVVSYAGADPKADNKQQQWKPPPLSATRNPALAAPPVSAQLASTAPPALTLGSATRSSSDAFTKAAIKSDAQKKLEASKLVGETLLEVMRVQVLTEGLHGLVDLHRKFVEMDKDGSKTLDKKEFKSAISRANVSFADSHLDSLFAYFDRDGSGSIDYDELLGGLRGQLSTKLLVLVHQAFDSLDRNGTNAIDPEQLLSSFNTSKHPDVLSGFKKEDEVLREFLDTVDIGVTVPGKMLRDDFVNYYSSLAAVVADESYMEVIIRSVWNLGSSSITAARLRLAQMVDRDSLTAQTQQQMLGQEYYSAREAGRVPRPPNYEPAMKPRPYSAPSTRAPRGEEFSSTHVDIKEVLEEVAVLRDTALKLYNQRDYDGAEQSFREVLSMLQSIYPTTHPDCLKMEQSILLVMQRQRL